MHFDDLNFERGYDHDQAYWQSKLANLLFTYELQDRLTMAGAGAAALAAHPGGARLAALERGALPILRAATDPATCGGEYYGPGGHREFTGYPVRVQSNARAQDTSARRRLREVSEQLTGVACRLPSTVG